jgi:hypothetical protein
MGASPSVSNIMGVHVLVRSIRPLSKLHRKERKKEKNLHSIYIIFLNVHSIQDFAGSVEDDM